MIFLDFETFSEADLKAVGSFRYAEHPSTEVLCAAWVCDDYPRVVLEEGDHLPLLLPAIHLGHQLVAHNVEFERNILRCKMGLDLPLDRFIDTAALAARMSLPRKLEELASFFGLDATAKLAADVAKKGDSVCRPRKPSKHDPSTRWTPATKPEAFSALYARCKQDVEITREIFKKLLPLEPEERELWLLTLKMNERGILVDLDSIPEAKRVLDEDAAPLIEEFRQLTGRKVKSYTKVAEALGLPDVRKPTVRKALRDPKSSPRVKRALEIYQALSKSSVAKLDAMLDRAGSDNRVRGSFLYCGADKTGRWSANGLQPQNFKRGLGPETEVAFAALHSGCIDPVFTGADRPAPDPPLTPTGTISEMLRGFILGPLFVGDLAQIEARGVAWLADDHDQLNLFRAKGDPYCAMASVIYGREVTKKNKDERFMGKQAELGCGYGLGPKGFIRMLDEIYDVQIEEDFAKRVVAAYRRRHPKIVDLWDRLGKGFVYAVAKKVERVRVTRNIWMGVVTVGGVPYAYIELPSGRRLYYPKPELDSTPRGPCVKFFGKDRYSGGWAFVRTYGGKVCENVTQAFSRDVIAGGILRVDAAGFPIVMTVHDEIVAEATGSLEEFKRLIEICPPWAPGLPIEVDVFQTIRYRK
jgi:DNA polymerase